MLEFVMTFTDLYQAAELNVLWLKAVSKATYGLYVMHFKTVSSFSALDHVPHPTTLVFCVFFVIFLQINLTALYHIHRTWYSVF